MVRTRVVGWTLLLGWIVALVGTFATGERPSTLDRLESDVAAGRVDEVTILGHGPLEGRGYTVVEARWDSGFLGHSTQVVETRPAGVHVPRSTREMATGVIGEQLDDRLTAIDPGLRVVHDIQEGGGFAELFGWRVTGWVAVALPLLGVATIARLAWGPPPRRATRWAWFWLILLVPLGPVAYLVMGGPAAGSSHRGTSKRLTGGWAFLIMLLLSPAVAAVGGA